MLNSLGLQLIPVLLLVIPLGPRDTLELQLEQRSSRMFQGLEVSSRGTF